MSKERARRRAEREREAAIRAAARATQRERRDRRAARARVARRVTLDRMPRLAPAGRPTGTLAHRRRVQTSVLIGLLVAVNVVVWVVRPDWASRFAALVVSILAAPVLVTLLLPRRR
jgi:Flp pilus assembly protein TadB